jgi:hypothetical protein
MGTYDYAIGNTTPKWDDHGGLIRLQQVMNTAAIIASNATLVAAAKITANDIIQCINVPAGFVVLSVGVNVSTAGTAGSTADFGLAGGTEIVAALDLVTTGYTVIAVTATWGFNNVSKLFTEADTIDVQYLADETIGEFTLTVVGYQL